MTADPERALREALRGTPLERRLAITAAPFLERRAKDLAALEISAPIARGLARLLGSSAEASRYLALRRELLPRLATADASTLERRTRELAKAAPAASEGSLEELLDAIRLFRRDETLFAACLDLGGVVSFAETSTFLSALAEALVQRTLDATRVAREEAAVQTLCVLGMGKLAGRELTYHSDLDLIFLYDGRPEAIHSVSRRVQRLIHYLATPTETGTTYAVDARLRPSGRQGMLVTSLDAFARYQLEQAQVWEHLALMRGRAIAGPLERAAPLLRGLQGELRGRRIRPWAEIGRLRRRIVAERARDAPGLVAFKTGAGGLTDAILLAAGAQLEKGAQPTVPEIPSVAGMLSGAVGRPAAEPLLRAYGFLRLLEARTRWVAGRAAEELRTSPETLGIVAELVRPGLEPAELLDRTARARTCIREACERVIAANTISALVS